ncbi:hypothetical protein ABIE66_002567 [Peribacillus sp. B2I2]
MLGFKSIDTATSIHFGVEAMQMIKKEQVDLWNHLSIIRKNSSISSVSSRFTYGLYKAFRILRF